MNVCAVRIPWTCVCSSHTIGDPAPCLRAGIANTTPSQMTNFAPLHKREVVISYTWWKYSPVREDIFEKMVPLGPTMKATVRSVSFLPVRGIESGLRLGLGVRVMGCG